MRENKDLSYLMQEREINLVDLIWKIVYSWRIVIIFGILCGCLLTGIKYSMDIQNDAVSEESTIENARAELSESEILKLDRAMVENVSIEKQLESRMEYQRDSILMNLDPYHVNQVTLQYYIDTHYTFSTAKDISKDYTKSLVLSYMNYITNSAITKDCAKRLNVEDDRYLAELIKIKPDLESQESEILDSIFCISIAGKDMEQTKAIAEIVQKALEQYQSELSSKIGTHDLVLVSDYEQIIQDQDLAKQQADIETAIYNLKVQQESLKSKLSARQLQILEYEQENKKESVEGDTVEELAVSKPGFSKKYMILGLLAGAFFACVVIAFRYIFSGYLKNEKELQEIYGLRIFGVIDVLEPSKKLFGFLDKWIDRLSGRQRGIRHKQMEITAANLLVACKKFGRDKVFFTSSVCFSAEEKKCIDQLIGQLTKEGIQVVYEENMMQNISALVQMSETGHIVLVEKAGQTKYQALEEELLLCMDQEAQIIGVIAVR